MKTSTHLITCGCMVLLTTLFSIRAVAQSPAQNFNGPVGIGIGTATPKGTFHVGGGQYMFGHVMYHAYEGDGQSGNAFIQARDNSGTSSIGMFFRTQLSGAYQESMRIRPNGDLEIGNGNNQLTVMPGKYFSGSAFVSDASSVAIDIPGTRRITFSDNIHLTDGNMGLGTLNALDKLQIKGALRIGSDAESDYLRLYHTPTRGYIESFEDDDGMFFKSNKAKAFTFNGFTLNIKPETMLGPQSSMIQFSDPDGGTAPMSIQFKDDGAPDLAIMGGKLGVNNLNPTETLDVTGNIKAATLKVDNIALSTVNTNTIYGNTAGALFTGSNNGNVAVGKGAAAGLNNPNYSVFLGYNAGKDFSHVTFEGGVNPLTAGKSVFVVNNQAQLHNPLLFGVFVDNTDKNDGNHHTVDGSMAQLGINTHHLVDSCALTVAGAVHIGPKDFDPAAFPRDSLYKDYLLWVERGIISENFAFGEVDRWSDFVFDEDYKLSPLSQVAEFIEKNNHLPEIPSEAQVKKHGYDQHGMNTLFLQKIEELTLYAIELEKKVAAYKELEERMKKLEAIIANKEN